MEIENPRPSPESQEPQPEILPPGEIDRSSDFDFKKLFRERKMEILEQTGFHNGPRARRKGYRLAAWSWLASFIDTLVLISLSCLFLLVFSWVMQIGAGSVVRELRADRSLGENFFQVFVLSSGIYMITLRAIMGASIGEWACDLSIGRRQDQLRQRYVLQVILRETLIIATGLVVLPLLSLLLGRDLAGKISGAELFSLK